MELFLSANIHQGNDLFGVYSRGRQCAFMYLSALLKALTHGAIFLATCNAILLLRDVKLANTSFHHRSLIYSEHIKHFLLIYISLE